MLIRKIDRKIERNILIGMIIDKNFLAKLSTVYKSIYFKNPYAQVVSKWCIEYYNQYEKAPFKEMRNIYDYHNKKGEVKDDQVDLLEVLLNEIDTEYKNSDDINIQFLLDKTEAYFNQIRLERLMVDIQNNIQEGDIKAAENEIINSKPISLVADKAIDPLTDIEKLREAFASSTKPLFELPGDLGLLMNEHLTRGSFVCFQAGEKVGKTWMLYYMAIQALKRRLKVVIFQIGDMTENQSRIRLSIAISHKPNKKKYCESFRKPIKFIRKASPNKVGEADDLLGDFDIDYEEVSFKTPLTADECLTYNQEFYKRFDIQENKFFKLITYPSDSINMRGIDIELDKLEKSEDFIADVVIVDYMDIAAPEDSRQIGRDAINGNWKMAKSICNKRHIILVSATQANKSSYNGETQTKMSVSEDKRKYAHVNCMVGMNQSDKEKKIGLMKFNMLVARESEYVTSRACIVLQCLKTGQPVIDSIFQQKETIKNIKGEKENNNYSNDSKNRLKILHR